MRSKDTFQAFTEKKYTLRHAFIFLRSFIASSHNQMQCAYVLFLLARYSSTAAARMRASIRGSSLDSDAQLHSSRICIVEKGGFRKSLRDADSEPSSLALCTVRCSSPSAHVSDACRRCLEEAGAESVRPVQGEIFEQYTKKMSAPSIANSFQASRLSPHAHRSTPVGLCLSHYIKLSIAQPSPPSPVRLYPPRPPISSSTAN